MHRIQNIDKKFPAFSRDCWIILCFKLLNLGGIHFLVDALTVLLSNYTPLMILEAVLLIMIGVLAVIVRRMYMGEEGEEGIY